MKKIPTFICEENYSVVNGYYCFIFLDCNVVRLVMLHVHSLEPSSPLSAHGGRKYQYLLFFLNLCRKFEDIFDVDHFIDYLKDDVQIVRDIPEWFTDKSELFSSIRFDGFLCFLFRAISKCCYLKSAKQIFLLECCLYSFTFIICGLSYVFALKSGDQSLHEIVHFKYCSSYQIDVALDDTNRGN